jgi:hypothetical protein
LLLLVDSELTMKRPHPASLVVAVLLAVLGTTGVASSVTAAVAAAPKVGDVRTWDVTVCRPTSTIPGAKPTCTVVHHKCTYKMVKRTWPLKPVKSCVLNY